MRPPYQARHHVFASEERVEGTQVFNNSGHYLRCTMHAIA